MTIDAQASLFGDGGMTPPQRASKVDPEIVRGRLNRLLSTLRAADPLTTIVGYFPGPNEKQSAVPEAELLSSDLSLTQTAQRLGVTSFDRATRVFVGNQYFTVVGVLEKLWSFTF